MARAAAKRPVKGPAHRRLRSKSSVKKKRAPMTQILREDKEWGVRLILKPFTDQREGSTTMEISAEIANPKPGRNPEIKLWFSGVPVSTPLRATEGIIWLAAMKTIMEEARKVADDLKEEEPKKTKRKK